ncbi:MAG: CvpA family protein [Desulfobulbus sp.]|jgi:membrane protein required for colicin V production|uniref:CvpA family protein n=1 Tax=Desulfobulbus sp. TaxID=895 RepID=UPI0028410EB1|nr:CvpA family protein [Desulfobulbus sp.]MDR2549404.1 CvpA family protein [Desulfobulbus sp.]
MPTLHDLTFFDLVVAALFLLFMVRGIWIGFVRQLAAFFALVGSYVIAGQYADRILPWTERFVDNPKLTFFVSFAILFVVSALVFTLIGKVLHRFLQITLMGWLDRLTGLLLGCAKAVLVASLLYMLLASTLSATNEMLRKSYSAPYLKQSAEWLRSFVDDPRMRGYLMQKEPAILNDLLPEKPAERKPEQKKPAQT